MLSSTGTKRLFLLVLFILTGYTSPVYAINFNANWYYRQRGGENLATNSEFTQNYNLGVGPAFTYQLTPAISLSAGLNYSRTQRDQGSGWITADRYNPYASIRLINDIFLAQASTSFTRYDRESGVDDFASWSTSLASNWKIPLFPDLRLSYSENYDPDTDIINRNTGFIFNWDLILAQLYYQYNINKSEEEFSNNESQRDTHFVRLETGGSFWDRRLSFDFAQQYRDSIQAITIEGIAGSGFESLVEGLALTKVYLVTDPPNIKDPMTDDYVDPDQSLPQEVNIDEDLHLKFITTSNFPEEIDILRLTLDDQLSVPQAEQLNWDLYTRRTETENWELVAENLVGSASIRDDAIDILMPFTITSKEFLVVTTNNSGQSLTFVTLVALRLITQSSERTTTDYLTNLNMGYRLTQKLTASASLTLEHSENDTADSYRENERQIVGGNLRWSPHPSITPSISFSESRWEGTGEPDQMSRTYSLILSTLPLETLKISLGTTVNEDFTDNLLTNSSYRYSLITSAQIYPDLTARWNLSYTEREDLDADGQVIDSNTLSSNLDIIAKLYRNLKANFKSGYQHREDDIRTRQTADARFDLQYLPSSLLRLRGTYTTFLLDNDATDVLRFNLGLVPLNTYKTRLTLDFIHTQADQTSNNLSLNWSWDINKGLTLVTKGNLSLRERYTYNIFMHLSLRL